MILNRLKWVVVAIVAWAALASLGTVASSRTGQITDQILTSRTIAPAHVFGTFDPATLTGGTLSNGNLTFTVAGAGNVVRATPLSSTQKTYGELKVTSCSCGGGNFAVGFVVSTQGTSSPTSIGTVPVGMWLWRDDAFLMNNGGSSALGSAPALNDVLNVAFDPVAGKGWFGKNGTWFGSGNPTTGANPAFTGFTGSITFMVNFQGTTGTPTILANFGATAFANTKPDTFYPL